ncbi:hypothetical protein Rcae01_05577 [Novipirellula caenicola]|uniref:Uncharacterized protein n=1 Tax=Novipirellula caenicola TaxID=1536901 RepID=A0ABP9VZ08_9BACT
MQPEVGQEDREGQENLKPRMLIIFATVTRVNRFIQSDQSQRDDRL